MSFRSRLWLFFITLNAYNTLSPEYNDTTPVHYQLAVDKPGIQVKMGGYLREEYIAAIGINSLLQNEINDYFTLFKHKGDLDVMCSFGHDASREPLAEAFSKLTSFLYWRAEDVYYPPLPEPIIPYTTSSLTSNSPPSANLSIQLPLPNHQHHFKTPLFFLGEGWLKLNANTLAPGLKRHIDFLKIGFFSYQVGRGITLGFSSEGGVDYLGWKRDNPSLTAPTLSPGFVIRGNLYKDLDYEFYYSKYRKDPGLSWQENGNFTLYRTDPTSISPKHRWGKDLDSNIYASKLLLKTKMPQGVSLYAEPYLTYFYEKNHTLELTADSRVWLGSYGMMLQGSYDNISCNIECAGQWGAIQVHAIDRNSIILSRNSIGSTNSTSVDTQFTKIDSTVLDIYNNPVTTDAGEFALAKDSTLQYVNTPLNRGPGTNGKLLVDNTGATLPSIGNDALSNPLYAINSSNRSRPAYTLNCKGFMAVADCEYRFKKHPFKLALATGYFSGDQYPLNNEVNKNYHGFLPLRDFKYQGLYVTSLFALALRWFPRPSNPAYNGSLDFFSVNNTEATTALAFIGTSFTVMPTGDEKKCSIKTNISCFFNTNPLYKWDPNGTIDDPILEARRLNAATTFNFQGWISTEKASSYMGTEINTVISYWLNENCELLTRLAALIPGTLFKDIDGQPNQITLANTTSNTYKAFALGQDTCWGINLRLNYYF